MIGFPAACFSLPLAQRAGFRNRKSLSD